MVKSPIHGSSPAAHSTDLSSAIPQLFTPRSMCGDEGQPHPCWSRHAASAASATGDPRSCRMESSAVLVGSRFPSPLISLIQDRPCLQNLISTPLFPGSSSKERFGFSTHLSHPFPCFQFLCHDCKHTPGARPFHCLESHKVFLSPSATEFVNIQTYLM